MSKIIAVTSLSVSVEFSDGTSKAYPISSCLGFSPAVGMEVDVVIEGSKTIIRLVNVASKSQNSDDSIFYGGKEFFKTKSSKDNAEYNYDDIPTLKPFTANNEPFLRVNKIIYLLLCRQNKVRHYIFTMLNRRCCISYPTFDYCNLGNY